MRPTHAAACTPTSLRSIFKNKRELAVWIMKQFKRVAAQDHETFDKVLPLVDWLTANFNTSDRNDMRMSMASYVSVDVNKGKPSLLAPPILRPSGFPTTKRKKSSVEAASQSSASAKSCSLCKEKGHSKPKCPTAAKIGQRLTEKNWEDYVQLPMGIPVDEKRILQIPKDLVGLQLSKRIPEMEMDEGICFVARGYRPGLSPSELAPFLVPERVVSGWCNKGKSQTRYVFVKSIFSASSQSSMSSSSSSSSSSVVHLD